MDGDGLASVSDDELTRLALAADPDTPIPADAVPIGELLAGLIGQGDGALLPQWYMPGSVRRPVRGQRWKRIVVLAVIVAFLAIDAYGLCSTYGWVTIA